MRFASPLSPPLPTPPRLPVPPADEICAPPLFSANKRRTSQREHVISHYTNTCGHSTHHKSLDLTSNVCKRHLSPLPPGDISFWCPFITPAKSPHQVPPYYHQGLLSGDLSGIATSLPETYCCVTFLALSTTAWCTTKHNILLPRLTTCSHDHHTRCKLSNNMWGWSGKGEERCLILIP